MYIEKKDKIFRYVYEEMYKKKSHITFDCPADVINIKTFFNDLYSYYPPLFLYLENTNTKINQKTYPIKNSFDISVNYSGLNISDIPIVKDKKDTEKLLLDAVASHKKYQYIIFKKEKNEIKDYVLSIVSIADYLNLFLKKINTSILTHSEIDCYGMKIEFIYEFSEEVCQSRKKEMNKKVKKIVRNAKNSSFLNYKRAFAVVKYCTENWKYDKSKTEKNRYNAYGAIVENKAVCDGFALALCIIFKELGIPCRYIKGHVNGKTHAWNMVYINGGWFFIDITTSVCSNDPFYGWGITKFEDGRTIETKIKEKPAYKCPKSFY